MLLFIVIYYIMNTVFEMFKNLLGIKKYIPKSQKDEIKQAITGLDKVKNKKLIEVLNKIIESKTLTVELRNTLNKLLDDLQKEDLTEQQQIDIIDDIIKEINDENLENILDMECDRYNKFTSNNPAEYIYYNKTHNNYTLAIPKNKEKKSKDLSKLINILKENVQQEKVRKFLQLELFKKISYKGKRIIIYYDNISKKPYFDINHVINLFDDINYKRDKYYEYKKSIEVYSIKNNNVNGFYIKEFISQETFFNMLLHTNSLFSNKFKNDIAKLLDQLTNQGQLMIDNDTLVLNNNVPNNVLIPKNVDHFKEDYIYNQTYENTQLLDFIKHLIVSNKQINYNKYLNKHVLYFFVITLDDPSGLNRILCKIGYTCDIIGRIKSLPNEYKCKFYLIGLKTIYSVQDEKAFHNNLKTLHPELVVDLKINDHTKDEIYVFDHKVFQLFNNTPDKVKFDDCDIQLEKETQDVLTNYFYCIESRFENEILLKLKNNFKIGAIVNEYKQNVAIKYIDYLMYHCKHVENMKDKEIELKKIELQMMGR